MTERFDLAVHDFVCVYVSLFVCVGLCVCVRMCAQNLSFTRSVNVTDSKIRLFVPYTALFVLILELHKNVHFSFEARSFNSPMSRSYHYMIT